MIAMPPLAPRTRTTPEQWDELRLAFHGSVMLEIPLASLAQNINGCSWDLEGPDEKPSTYIDLTHAEVLARLRAREMPAGLIDNLADILRGTLAFDDSFGAMVEIAGRVETDPVARNLERLRIPPEFPISLCAFTPATTEFCRREGIDTLAQFIDFSRRASRHLLIGGEFRDLLKAIAHIDEDTLARLLPFRPRSTGLHLVESLALVVRPLPLEERMRLAREPGTASPELIEQAALRMRHFADSTQRLRTAIAEGSPLARLVVSLDDLSLEAAVAALLGRLLTPPPPAAPSPAPKPAKPRGLLLRLLGKRN
jgi:hypothetical protein